MKRNFYKHKIYLQDENCKRWFWDQVRPRRQFIFRSHRETFFCVGLEASNLCWKHIFTFQFLSRCLHTNVCSHYYLWTRYAVIFLDPSVFRKLQTFFSARTVGRREHRLVCIKIHFLAWRSAARGTWNLVFTSDSVKLRLEKGKNLKKGTWEGGERRKIVWRSKEIKLFLNKTGEFMSFFCESPILGT